MLLWLAQAAPTGSDRPIAQWERTAQLIFKDAFENIDRAFPTSGFVMALAGLLIMLLALWGYKSARQRRYAASPAVIFHRLGDHVGLSLQDQWLLLRISRQQALPTPITLMLSGTTLDHHARAYIDRLPPRSRDAARTRIKKIALKIFG
jgi:hypothetical protein